MSDGLNVCNRCVMDSTAPAIRFDDQGTCSYCRLHARLDTSTGHLEGTIEPICERMKKEGRNAKYDCVVGLSGGTDSTYCVYLVKKLGLRPLAVHFENGWVSDVARANLRKIAERLGVEVRTVRVDWEHLRRWYRACFEASVAEMCLPCEIGIASSLYRVADEEGVRTVILGHSFRTEGITPLAWHYVDGRYFESVLARQGVRSAESAAFNRLKLLRVGTDTLWKGIRTIQLPLYVRGYHDETIRAELAKELDWEYGGHHHFDCVFKPFVAHIQARKFNMDLRKVTFSALIRTGQMERSAAVAALAQTPTATDAEIDAVLAKLEMTRADFDRIVAKPPLSFTNYSSYFSFLSLMKLPLKLMSKLRLVPQNIYEKLFET